MQPLEQLQQQADQSNARALERRQAYREGKFAEFLAREIKTARGQVQEDIARERNSGKDRGGVGEAPVSP